MCRRRESDRHARSQEAGSAQEIAVLGHEVFGALAAMAVRTFMLVTAQRLASALKSPLPPTTALSRPRRTVSPCPRRTWAWSPGGAGVSRLPQLIGPRNSIKVMIENELANNRTLNIPVAHDMGIAC